MSKYNIAAHRKRPFAEEWLDCLYTELLPAEKRVVTGRTVRCVYTKLLRAGGKGHITRNDPVLLPNYRLQAFAGFMLSKQEQV